MLPTLKSASICPPSLITLIPSTPAPPRCPLYPPQAARSALSSARALIQERPPVRQEVLQVVLQAALHLDSGTRDLAVRLVSVAGGRLEGRLEGCILAGGWGEGVLMG